MGAALFILSFRHRDELTRLAEDAGWQPIAARRADNAEARFVASGASVAVVDARGALDEGLEAVRAVADAVEANAAALLVLVSRKDARALDAFHQHGATHFLVSPFTAAQLHHALLFARQAGLLDDDETAALKRRVRRILRDGTLPVDLTGMRYPWPLV